MVQHQLINPQILNHCPKLKAQELKRQYKQKEAKKAFAAKLQQIKEKRDSELKNLQFIAQRATKLQKEAAR